MTTSNGRAERRAATAAKILAAARAEFGEQGEEGATIRGIARRAGVDPSLVLQHYGSKQALFSLAVRPATDLDADDVPGHLSEVLAARLHELPPATRALMRSMLTSPEAAAVMRDYLQERTENLARTMGGEDAELRAAMVVSSILGVTIARHFLELPPLTEADEGAATRVFEEWLATLR
ncbi:TetR/AcrR family transcriptional regulator [Leifsonia sp. ku-ls]|nr:TetR/AcrR family transcriptional regulator [Leifsonia sp. ku-ls]